MTQHAKRLSEADVVPDTGRGPLAARWIGRTIAVYVTYCAAVTVLPWLFAAAGPWRAFGAGMVVPGAGLLYSIPSTNHSFPEAMVVGHAVVIATELAVVAWTLRSNRLVASSVAAVGLCLVLWGCLATPAVVVVAGHVAGFLGVLAACGWAFGVRLIGRADSVTPVTIVVVSAAAGAALSSLHGGMTGHAKTGGPMTWIPWAALGVAVGAVIVSAVYVHMQDSRARRVGDERRRYLETRYLETKPRPTPRARTGAPELRISESAPLVTEASLQELQLLRYLLSVALQPVDDWDSFDDEAAGPLQQYRYQVNALGWALAMYQYSHAPAYSGALSAGQLSVVERAQRKAVWGYWYWQNLLGNWDFLKRRADPIDVPQNIMFTGYLNLQLAMFRQATGDPRFDEPGSIAFDWSPRQRCEYSHQEINAISIRNFDQDLCLWPCEPVISPGRKRGFVFPYCNAVTTAGIAVMDTVNQTDFAPGIANRVEKTLATEFTVAGNDLASFIISGLGLRVRSVMVGTSVTATIAAFLAPLCPDLAWRAWEMLKRDWLESGQYRVAASAGAELPDWATNAKTNAAPIAGAMLLANSCGEREWRDELWSAAAEQLTFRTDGTGVGRFHDASVYGNGMIGFGGFARPSAFRDMATKPRPTEWHAGPRLKDAPHPDVLVARAVTDGEALDLVIHPAREGTRALLEFDRLRPGGDYVAHGGVDAEFRADAAGTARVAVDVAGRTAVAVRPE